MASRIHLLILALITFQVNTTLAEEQMIRTAEELRTLAPKIAKKNLPVEMEVVATFVDRVKGMLFVHDGKNGFFVAANPFVKQAKWLVAGRKLRLRGVTTPGEFMPVVLSDALEDLGPGTMPTPPVYSFAEEIMSPKDCSQWVEVEGVVKRVTFEHDGLVLSLQVGEYRLPMEMPKNGHFEQPPSLPLHLLEQRVRVRVVAATQFNKQRQMSGRMLFLPSLEYLTKLDTNLVTESAPLRRVDELLLASSPLNERVKVRGVVTHAVPEQGLFIRGEGGSMRIDSALTPTFHPGTLIEAEGEVNFYPYRPRLTAVALRELGKGPAPKPLPLDTAGIRHSAEQFELVTLDTTYQDMMQTSIDSRLLCRSGEVRFEAKLPEGLRHQLKLEPKMRLRLTGICKLELSNPYGIARFTKVFSLSLRSVDDIVILEKPPFWNNKRLLILLTATGGMGLLFAVWSWMLRRKVAEQSAVIEQQTTARATLDERQRIARDLHDTLEQELSGVAMLLESSCEQYDCGDNEARQSLDLARQLLRRSREESRSTICELRSRVVEEMGLLGAMEQTLQPLANAANLTLNFQVSGIVTRLPGTVEVAFLRIAHEAVANALKHSGGSHVEVRLAFSVQQLQLEVTDDGAGFFPESAADDSSGHFGVTGMRERAGRIGAHFVIDANVGRGTRVILTWQIENPKM